MKINRIKRYSYILLLVNLAIVSLVSTGCKTTVQPVDNLEDLVDRLEKSGLEIQITGQSVRNIHLSVEGYVLTIESENTQLFEYADVDTATTQFKALTGPSPGLVFFEDNEPPVSESVPANLEAYHSGRFILLYSGADEEVKKALKATFGQPAQPR